MRLRKRGAKKETKCLPPTKRVIALSPGHLLSHPASSKHDSREEEKEGESQVCWGEEKRTRRSANGFAQLPHQGNHSACKKS